MADSGKVAIIVALIGAAGVIGSKYIEVAKPAATAPATPAAAVPESAVSAAPAQPQTNTAPPVQPVAAKPADPVPTSDSPPPAPHPAAPNLAGTWVDAGGIAYTLVQNGVQFEVSGQLGTTMVVGQGALVGRSVRWTYQNNIGGAGQCQGSVAEGDQLVTATCQQVGGPPYMIQLNRAG
jgi:hypothetical protein